jgi:hypothetical protein
MSQQDALTQYKVHYTLFTEDLMTNKLPGPRFKDSIRRDLEQIEVGAMASVV